MNCFRGHWRCWIINWCFSFQNYVPTDGGRHISWERPSEFGSRSGRNGGRGVSWTEEPSVCAALLPVSCRCCCWSRRGSFEALVLQCAKESFEGTFGHRAQKCLQQRSKQGLPSFFTLPVRLLLLRGLSWIPGLHTQGLSGRACRLPWFTLLPEDTEDRTWCYELL